MRSWGPTPSIMMARSAGCPSVIIEHIATHSHSAISFCVFNACRKAVSIRALVNLLGSLAVSMSESDSREDLLADAPPVETFRGLRQIICIALKSTHLLPDVGDAVQRVHDDFAAGRFSRQANLFDVVGP